MKTYENYKYSGVKWIGEIPEYWKVKKIGYYLDFSRGLSITKQNLKDEGVPCVNYGEIHSKFGVIVNPEIHPLKYVDEQYLDTSKKSLLKRGDFVFADTSEDIEGSGNFTCLDSDTPTFAGYHTIILRQNEVDYKFLMYYFDSLEYRNQIRSAVYGVKVYSITQAILKETSFIHPPTKEEQTAIANYLDKKTAEIDQLIAEKKQLVALYQEEKTAIINQAVTKGINQDVQLKDSGVEWLGKIPEHWEVKRLKYLADKLISGPFGSSLKKETYTEEGYKIYGQEQVIKGDVNFGDYYISETKYLEMSRYKVEKDDILISCVGTFGKILLIPDGFEKGIINPRLINLSPNNKLVKPIFLYEILKSEFTFNQLISMSRGGTMGVINLDLLKQLNITVPPKEEQILIVQHIEKESARIDAKIAKAEQYINLLTEYRTALISEVVTGKIKVID